MPILAQETDIYPEDLFEIAAQATDSEVCWWALYTLSRREKDLMRRLLALDVPFYCPIISKRNRSPAGRVRTSYVPMFHNYVFIHGDEMQRYQAVSTGCVSKQMRVVDGAELTNDLRQIHGLIQAGVPLSIESRLQAGERVRVRSGPFRDYEGTVLRREGQTRLLVAVNFLQQGASVLLDDCQLEII
jgi:transcription antitermination factor NusG